jgi:hypothetical protein
MSSKKETECGVCATPEFERNNYFYGKQFTVRDLSQEQSYVNEKRWLINRMVLGWGVVCGLEVRWDSKKRQFITDRGMALDCCGHEIVVCEPQKTEFEHFEEECGYAEKDPKHERKFVLCLEYHECNAEPVDLPAVACGDQERTEFNRVRDGFKLRVRPWHEVHPEHPKHLNCLNRYKHNESGEPPANPCRTETLHEYLCRKLTDCPDCESCECVVLATIHVKAPKGPHEENDGQYELIDKRLKVKVDACTDRRFVYNNQLLFNLTECYHGDLPHIVDFNWRKHSQHDRKIEWETFVKLIEGGLTVYFDREITPASLSRHTFLLSFLHEDPDSGNIFVKRLPTRGIVTGKAGKCFTATWLPDEAWFKDELISAKSQLRGGVDVEITLLGSRIWDERGKALDGAFLNDKLPTGNGTQGTEFFDWFRVLPRGHKKSEDKTYKNW